MADPRERSIRIVTPCCFRAAGAYHPSDCPNRPERWADRPIRADECMPHRLVPVAEAGR